MKRLLSFMLLVLTFILSAFLVRETWTLVKILLSVHPEQNGYNMIDALIVWFLYFEFIALIAKYFESKLHFPLRYFIYIGITAIVRLIIVDHENPTSTLVYSSAIIVLLGSLYIANTAPLRRI